MIDLTGLGFWIFMATLVYVSHKQYMAGHDTFFFTHKTDAEKAIRDKISRGEK